MLWVQSLAGQRKICNYFRKNYQVTNGTVDKIDAEVQDDFTTCVLILRRLIDANRLATWWHAEVRFERLCVRLQTA